MAQRLHRRAESHFQTLASDAGALCHTVTEDESGWDRLIEFPNDKFEGPSDLRPPMRSAYVQIKSKKKKNYSCRIKLSNALRAAISDQPWFLILAHDDGSPIPQYYGLHIWADEISAIIKSVRKCEHDGIPLHKTYISFTISETNGSNENLIEWIKSCINKHGQQYGSLKTAISKTCGYENGAGTGRIVIQAVSTSEIAMNFLGAGSGLNVAEFSFTPARFGIPDITSVLHFTEGKIHIAPEPQGDVEIRLRNTKTNDRLAISGKVYRFETGTEVPSIWIRVETPFLELIFQNDGTFKYHIKIDHQQILSTEIIEKYFKICTWMNNATIDLQIWASGIRVFGAILPASNKNKNENALLAMMLDLVRKIDTNNIVKIKLNDIPNGKNLKKSIIIYSSNILSIIFDDDSRLPSNQFSNVIFWMNFVIGEYTFYCILQLDISDDSIMPDGKREIKMTTPSILEGYVVQNREVDGVSMIKADYEKILDKNSSFLGLENIFDNVMSAPEVTHMRTSFVAKSDH